MFLKKTKTKINNLTQIIKNQQEIIKSLDERIGKLEKQEYEKGFIEVNIDKDKLTK